MGRLYQQTFVDTYSKVAFCKLYTSKTPITAADILNDKVLPFFEEHRAPVLRILTDRGTEFCGKAESHPFELYLAKQRLDLRKQTVSVKDFTRQSCQSFTKFHFAKDFTFRLMSCKKILTNGFAIIITGERTKARCAVAELRW